MFSKLRIYLTRMNAPYDADWDKALNRALDAGAVNFDSGSKYTAIVAQARVWIGSYPFAYGTTHLSSVNDVRASRATIHKLRTAHLAYLREVQKRDVTGAIADMHLPSVNAHD